MKALQFIGLTAIGIAMLGGGMRRGSGGGGGGRGMGGGRNRSANEGMTP
ncbi:MAG: hypothetical protein KJ702_02065 [Gammaproteobacteria bacterium]|nr:hypothetical protein [Gammaproteobacteria bacterium]